MDLARAFAGTLSAEEAVRNAAEQSLHTVMVFIKAVFMGTFATRQHTC